ncbi:DUF58 domain-containing protein [Crateriforma spongiae]|uniref:DUF58 domain-containing protein n=1 Tax=Crateriforma spongiae TaxID=2724528 RepID=UPI001444B6EC|nr:DUF58 domain-containing protein [Crateriforma spongiae]
MIRRTRLTRLGWHFGFVIAFAMLGGAIRGLNLLLVLAAIMVGALITQWRWCTRAAESVDIRRRLPSEAFAGTPFRVRFRLTNHNRFLPLWMLRITDQIVLDDQRNSGRWLKVLGGGTAGPEQRAKAVSGIGVVGGRQTVTPSYICRIADRGSYRFGPVTVSTTFPFSLMKAEAQSDLGQVLDVYPRLLRLRRGWKNVLLQRTGGATVGAHRGGNDEGDFFGLREYHPGDNPKWIHWRTTARLGDLAVRQFEQQRRYDVCLLLDAWYAPDQAMPSVLSGSPSSSKSSGANWSGRIRTGDDVETAISLAATLLVDLASQPGNRVVFASAGVSSRAMIAGTSFEARRRLFQTLARIQPSAKPPIKQTLDHAVEAVGLPQDLIVASPRSQEDAMNGDPELRDILTMWARRGRIRWLDVTTDTVGGMIVSPESNSQPSPGTARSGQTAKQFLDTDAAASVGLRKDEA